MKIKILVVLFLTMVVNLFGQNIMPSPMPKSVDKRGQPLATFSDLTDQQKVFALTQSMAALSNQNAQLTASNVALATALAVNTNLQSITWDAPVFVANYTNVYNNTATSGVQVVTNISHVTNTYIVMCSSGTNWITNELATNSVTFSQLAPARVYNFRIYTKSSYLVPNPISGQPPVVTNDIAGPIKGSFVSSPNVAITVTNGLATILWGSGTNVVSLYASSGTTNWKLATNGVPNAVASYMEKVTLGVREFKRQ